MAVDGLSTACAADERLQQVIDWIVESACHPVNIGCHLHQLPMKMPESAIEGLSSGNYFYSCKSAGLRSRNRRLFFR